MPLLFDYKFVKVDIGDFVENMLQKSPDIRIMLKYEQITQRVYIEMTKTHHTEPVLTYCFDNYAPINLNNDDYTKVIKKKIKYKNIK